ncbi:MAG: phosphatase PAP2 family protein [Cyclobacteriaceae bacterium]
MNRKLARFISRVGHPVFLLAAFLSYTLFSIHQLEKAILTVFGVILIGILPLVVWNFVHTKRGVYSNFDVSIRRERYSMYGFIAVLSLLVMVFLLLTDQPFNVLLGCLLIIELVMLAFLINFRLKISLHVAMSIYVAFGLLSMNRPLAWLLLVAVPLIAWSRWQLGRHRVSELVGGVLLGLFCGMQLLYFNGQE